MKLFLKKFGKTLQELNLEEGKEYFVGRHKDCDLVLEEETGVSRRHLKIFQSLETRNWQVELISELGGLCLEGEELEGVELEDSVCLSLRNYVLDFVKEKEKSISEVSEKKATEEKQKMVLSEVQLNSNLDDKTKVFNPMDYIYSLHVFIEGEFSDHINLNEKNSWLIGRSEECDISIDYNILTRKHLRIIRKENVFYVEDLGSANKTFLNEKELISHKPVRLTENDHIHVSDLQILFEVRHQNFNKLMNQLPALHEGNSEEESNYIEAPFPKVVLEDSYEEEEEKLEKSSFFKRKKYLLAFVAFLFLGFFFYFKQEEKKKNKKIFVEKQKEIEQKQKIDFLYQEALNNHSEGNFVFCKDKLEELHSLSPTGFSDSIKLLYECEQGLLYQKQKEAMLKREEKRKKTLEKIEKIVQKCQKEYQEKKIQTEEELDACAEELLSGALDPNNSEISAMRQEIIEKNNLKKLNKEKHTQEKNLLKAKRALYYRAKQKAKQNKALEAVSAYNVFLGAVRGLSALKNLSDQARNERDEIQRHYDEELNRLYQSCQSLIQQEKMKEAYKACHNILLFKAEDEKALENKVLAKNHLRKILKKPYAESLMHESFSRIDEAKRIWKEILEKDIKDGYYYRKAFYQLQKYK